MLAPCYPRCYPRISPTLATPGPGPHLLRLVARLDYVKVDVDDDIVEIAWVGLTGRVSSH
jgi:hypothetical protein